MSIKEIKEKLDKLSNPQKAKDQARFFKTGPGEYGEGDIFIGIKVPELRKLSRKYKDLPIKDISKLLKSPIHEYRHLALFILVLRYQKSKTDEDREHIYKIYLKNTKYINNWDLVDCSAMYIVGPHLFGKSTNILFKLSRSKDLWERRISIIATFDFIRRLEFSTTFELSKRLLRDKEDLIHKATGWMLREVGNRSLKELKLFLNEHYLSMPRTMLRYAIEKFPEATRQAYLKSKI